MLYIGSSDFIHLISEHLYPFANLSLFLTPTPGNHCSILRFYVSMTFLPFILSHFSKTHLYG